MSERAQDRLSRLLGLVPYLTRRPGTDLDEVAAHFGVPRAQIVDDLELLFVTGRPGHMPDDLIEAEWGSGAVFVGNADEVSVPVRLSAHEAGGLLLALDYLDSARQAEPEVLASVRAKLATAAGEVPGTAVDAAPPRIPAELAATVRAAIETGETLDIDYYVPARDELTRTASPPAVTAPSPSTASAPRRRPPPPCARTVPPRRRGTERRQRPRRRTRASISCSPRRPRGWPTSWIRPRREAPASTTPEAPARSPCRSRGRDARGPCAC
jgi:hypothetical protein